MHRTWEKTIALCNQPKDFLRAIIKHEIIEEIEYLEAGNPAEALLLNQISSYENVNHFSDVLQLLEEKQNQLVADITALFTKRYNEINMLSQKRDREGNLMGANGEFQEEKEESEDNPDNIICTSQKKRKTE